MWQNSNIRVFDKEKEKHISIKLTFKTSLSMNFTTCLTLVTHQIINTSHYGSFDLFTRLPANGKKWKYKSWDKEKLDAAYNGASAPTLARRINRWLDRDFGFDIFGLAINVGKIDSQEEKQKTLIERVNQLEDIILSNIDNSRYLIIFDELDEDYKTITEEEQYKKYTSLITGLFKAAQDIKAIFNSGETKIYPIIFLRDDIYEILQDSDKTKWNDLKISLDWDYEKIKQLMAFRISRAIDSEGEILITDCP